MHGGFENETPNIPTNTIVKLELPQIFKAAPGLASKLEAIIGAGSPSRAGTGTGGSRSGSTSPSDGTNRSQTPPMTALAKQNEKIRIAKAEIEIAPGDKPKTISLTELQEEGKQGSMLKKPNDSKGAPQKNLNSIDTLYSLFLNHLLRPREWSAQFDGSGYFAFRREHIIALAEECQKVLEEQAMVLRVDAPIKVFGDIHGQY
jgi:hypothetical protein